MCISSSGTRTLWRLAMVGFPIQVAREILKDVEDVDVDRGNIDGGDGDDIGVPRKVTLPLVVGTRWSHRIAYALVGAVCGAMVFTETYWKMFASTNASSLSRLPVLASPYGLGVCAGVPMCIRASVLPIKEGERLLKKSIYVLLAGMIGGLLL